MSDYEVHKAANEYVDRSFPKDAKALKPAGLMNDAFCAGVEWARAQWPITPRTAEEAKPEDFGQALGLMWADLGKKLEEVSIFCGALEGQANRIQRETQEAIGTLGEGMAEILKRQGEQSGVHPHLKALGKNIVAVSEAIELARNENASRYVDLKDRAQAIDDQVRKAQAIGVDVGQKVEAVISLVDDLDELIRSEDGEAEPLTAEELGAFKEGVDEAYRPAVGMFGIGGDASVASIHRPEPTLVMKKRTMGNGLKFRVGDGEATVLGADPASPDDDATVMTARDGEGRMYPITPPGWAGKIRDVFIHNNQLFVQCEAGLFTHFGGKTLTPLEFGA